MKIVDKLPFAKKNQSNSKSNKPHIIHIVKTLDKGGIESLVFGLKSTTSFGAFQHSVLCFFSTEGRMASSYQMEGIQIDICPVNWPTDHELLPYRFSRILRKLLRPTFPNRLAGLLKSKRADLIHSHIESRIDEQTIGVLHRAKLPFIWSIHGRYQPEGTELYRWRQATRHIGKSRNGCITADSEAIETDLINRIPHAAHIVKVIRPGADVSSFTNNIKKDPAWRKNLGIPPDAILFGSSGRLAYEKGPDIFFQAAKYLDDMGVNAHFALSGEGTMSTALKEEIERSRLEHRFHLLGFQEDLPFIHKQFDVFVLASRSEGFPLALIEALASGLPCIATDVGGVSEMLAHGGGLVVPPESPRSLADAMHQFLDFQARSEQSELGPQIAKNFSFEDSAKEFSKLYYNLLGLNK